MLSLSRHGAKNQTLTRNAKDESVSEQAVYDKSEFGKYNV
jgi:hypothetical protein